MNERTEISVEMAIRLSKAFGSTPETEPGMQMAYDLWQAPTAPGRSRRSALWRRDQATCSRSIVVTSRLVYSPQ